MAKIMVDTVPATILTITESDSCGTASATWDLLTEPGKKVSKK